MGKNEVKPIKSDTILSKEDFLKLKCTLVSSDPEYLHPSPVEIDALIKFAGWTQVQTAKICGVSYNVKKGSTTVRKWRSDKSKAGHIRISYSKWRLMLLYAKIVDVSDGGFHS